LALPVDAWTDELIGGRTAATRPFDIKVYTQSSFVPVFNTEENVQRCLVQSMEVGQIRGDCFRMEFAQVPQPVKEVATLNER
jgi:hypothetical protein